MWNDVLLQGLKSGGTGPPSGATRTGPPSSSSSGSELRNLGGRMRFNKAEVAALASQPSGRFDKEGTLFVRERQEGFFRRTESELDGAYFALHHFTILL